MEAGRGHGFTIALWLVATIAFCLFASAPASAGASKLSSPSKLVQDYEAQVAVAGDDLWLSVLGSDRRGKFRIEVHRWSGSSWTTLPERLPTLYEKDHRFTALTPDSGPTVPCVGDSPRDRARIRCYRDGGWSQLEIDPTLADMVVTGLKADGPVLTASFTRWNRDGSSTVGIGRSSGGAVTPAGPPLELGWRVLSSLGKQTTDAPPGAIDLSLETWSGPAPWTLASTSLESGDWTGFDRLPVSRTGQQQSGPVRSAGGLFFPVTRALPGGNGVSNWRASVYRNEGKGWRKVNGKQVGNAPGANSGGVYAVGDRVWFLWLRIWLGRRGIDTRLVAIRVARDGSSYDRRIVLLRNNADQNYQDPQVVAYRGRPVFLYQRSNQGHWRATLDFSRR